MQDMAEEPSKNIPRSDITPHEIITEFEEIRKKQRKVYAELIETEMELKEHR